MRKSREIGSAASDAGAMAKRPGIDGLANVLCTFRQALFLLCLFKPRLLGGSPLSEREKHSAWIIETAIGNSTRRSATGCVN